MVPDILPKYFELLIHQDAGFYVCMGCAGCVLQARSGGYKDQDLWGARLQRHFRSLVGFSQVPWGSVGFN